MLRRHVSGSLTWVNPYKGGCRPPPDIEAEGRRTKPCPNVTMVVRSFPTNDEAEEKNTATTAVDFDLDSPYVAELKTDAEGEWKLQLPPGTYHVYRASKVGKPSWYGNATNSSSSSTTQRMIPGGGMDRKENEKWRRKADCMFVVTAAAGGEEEEQKGVLLHWVNGREAGLPLPC